jgi:hypothetical protein
MGGFRVQGSGFRREGGDRAMEELGDNFATEY